MRKSLVIFKLSIIIQTKQSLIVTRENVKTTSKAFFFTFASLQVDNKVHVHINLKVQWFCSVMVNVPS